MKRPQWLTRGTVLISCGVVIALGGAIALGYSLKLTGFGADETVVTSKKIDRQGNVIERTEITTPQEAKTLWDWLSLLGVPLSLALLAWWLQQLQQKRADRELKQEKETAEAIAAENRREEALQTYFDRISTLLVEKNLLAIAAKGDEATEEEKELLDVSVDIIRARTLSILRQLKDDRQRKTSVMQFLIEAEVISKLGLDLSGAYLDGAYLDWAYLDWAYFIGACFIGAYLSYAKLTGAILIRAILREADLRGAILIRANLTGAILLATDLREAILLTKEQLEGEDPPLLCNVALPEGFEDIDPNRDCGKLAKVLVERYPEEFKTLEDAQKAVNDARKKKWD